MRKKSGLEKVLKFSPTRDIDNKRFIPYCDFGWHQGYIRQPHICEERGCKYYRKLYL